MTELQQLRNSRRKETAEDFTPEPLVNEMLDKLPLDCFTDPLKTFCDPAAGNGNFLVVVLSRKLSHNHPPLQALSTLFSVELMPDNTEEMKERLLSILPPLSDDELREARKILDRNIICHDALTWNFDKWKSNKRSSKSLF